MEGQREVVRHRWGQTKSVTSQPDPAAYRHQTSFESTALLSSPLHVTLDLVLGALCLPGSSFFPVLRINWVWLADWTLPRQHAHACLCSCPFMSEADGTHLEVPPRCPVQTVLGFSEQLYFEGLCEVKVQASQYFFFFFFLASKADFCLSVSQCRYSFVLNCLTWNQYWTSWKLKSFSAFMDCKI